MGISVSCDVREYPDEDKPYSTLIVRSHWNYSDRVVMRIGGTEYIFLADDLIRAVNNARNHR